LLTDCWHLLIELREGALTGGDVVTRAKRAWCKANRYVRSGQHAKAIYWFEKTQKILNEARLARRRHGRMDLGYMLIAFAALILILANRT
jgi:hypothetical protein